MALRPGAIVGGYRVIQVLGAGGMGTVYLAQNPILPRRDALKVLSAELSTDDEFRARFEREANLAAGLDHPNIVTVYNRGEEDGKLWIAMQYIDGTDASKEAKKGPSVMTPQRALRIIAEVGKGLDYAHRRGLLHRDVKPANFLLSAPDEGDEERVLLTDFGVAKSSEDGQDLTATGNFMATVAYASPEQLMGERLDHRSDLYSLGCSFYRLLTDQNPYPSTMPAVVMMGHLHEPPPKLSAARAGLPPALDGVLEKVLAKDPADRYNSCREFVQDAQAVLYGAQFHAPGPAHMTDPRHPTQGGYTTDSRHQTHSGYTTGPTHQMTGGYGTDPRHQVTSYPTEPRTSALGFGAPPDQSTVETARNGRDTGRSKRRKLLIPAIVGLVVVTAVAAGTFFLTRPSGDSGGGGADLAQVRADNPQFDGKTLTAFNFGNGTLSVVLTPSDQSKFLQNIGFTYNTEFKAVGEEKSPRQLSASSYSADVETDVVLVFRTDSAAGNGGLGGLPRTILNSKAKIVVIDELSTVQAFQVWTDQSERVLIDTMVPVIAKVVTQ
ncbi:protein kinase [Nocardia puris]|uniref:serine/threonine-protein kinase n=1 Tax=Nocardia puris TaxID=208602 RepID=UPI001893138E|nr:serine/threonine-protein kinase [Nocardia puris]MBF6212509.1 protein kinase [Nocardia puris]MBF6366756.1 protein kinase [Nocardia puris]MBF6461098.1 protein kinase [Nocardia puris]